MTMKDMPTCASPTNSMFVAVADFGLSAPTRLEVRSLQLTVQTCHFTGACRQVSARCAVSLCKPVQTQTQRSYISVVAIWRQLMRCLTVVKVTCLPKGVRYCKHLVHASQQVQPTHVMGVDYTKTGMCG